ncbi:MAG: glycosyltransferase family 4 protein, partial [Nitrospirota bacterium]
DGCGMLYAGPLYVPCVSENLIKFIKHSYPKIREQVPGAQLTLLGKNPIKALRKLIAEDRSIHHVDFVDDYEEFMNRDWVYIHPQHGAAGYKTKIQQVMALGLPVVGTEYAFTGLDMLPGEHCYLCKTDDEFIENVIRLLRDKALRSRIGIASAQRIRNRHSIERIGEEMIDVYRGIAGR